ncbi:hypothetical protein PENSPDRAFT_647787 [Peniophora sp. CONT]|nr:hypothetical protein PENSPDRAFT_647787 [Peniophora sp. CONT]
MSTAEPGLPPPSPAGSSSRTSPVVFAAHAPSTSALPTAETSPSGSPRSLVLDISSPSLASRTPAEQDVDQLSPLDTAPPPVPRLLGINYVPSPVEEQDEPSDSVNEKAAVHPLRLDVHPPSPLPWEGVGGDDESARTPGTSEDMKGAGARGFPRNVPSKRLEPPRSSYYFGPPPADSAYGTDPIGQLGVHHPREVVRIERDYSGGEVVQFTPAYPLEFEGRITPTQFLETINALNEVLFSAYSLRYGLLDNVLDIFSLHLSKLVLSTHYDREMRRLQRTIDDFNTRVYAPAGLYIRWPRDVGFLFLEIEYY